MTEYDNTNRGVLFKNDRKESDKHPDYKGNINVGGVEYWLSAWIKEGQKGKFMSLSIQPKEEQKAAPRSAMADKVQRRVGQISNDPISTGRPRQNDDLDDQIPFLMEWRG